MANERRRRADRETSLNSLINSRCTEFGFPSEFLSSSVMTVVSMWKGSRCANVLVFYSFRASLRYRFSNTFIIIFNYNVLRRISYSAEYLKHRYKRHRSTCDEYCIRIFGKTPTDYSLTIRERVHTAYCAEQKSSLQFYDLFVVIVEKLIQGKLRTSRDRHATFVVRPLSRMMYVALYASFSRYTYIHILYDLLELIS